MGGQVLLGAPARSLRRPLLPAAHFLHPVNLGCVTSRSDGRGVCLGPAAARRTAVLGLSRSSSVKPRLGVLRGGLRGDRAWREAARRWARAGCDRSVSAAAGHAGPRVCLGGSPVLTYRFLPGRSLGRSPVGSGSPAEAQVPCGVGVGECALGLCLPLVHTCGSPRPSGRQPRRGRPRRRWARSAVSIRRRPLLLPLS